MTVLGVHHVGLAVARVEAVCLDLGRLGFAGDPWFEVSGPDGARGNGLDSLTMRVAFVSDGLRTIEVIEPVRATNGPVPDDGDAGHQTWALPTAGGTGDPPVDLPGVALSGSGVDSVDHEVGLVAADPAATLELLSAVGLATTGADVVECAGARIRVHRATTSRPAPAPDVVGRSHVALQVVDAGSTHERLSALGFDCVSAPIAHGDAIRWFFVRDPGGSGQIELIEDRA